MSDTPRTDAAVFLTIGAGYNSVDPNFARELERENAKLRAVLVNADELERYGGLNGERQWGRCSAWLHPDDAVIIISATALDAARKGEQP